MSRKAHRACVMLDMAALAGPVSCAVSPSYYSLYSEVRQEFFLPPSASHQFVDPVKNPADRWEFRQC